MGLGKQKLRYLLTDHLGGTSKLLDEGGAVVAGSEVQYWPYGGVRTGALTGTDKGFTGQRSEPLDPGLGIYNYNARFYSTALGRFLSPDPLTADGLNRYTYVGNNPLAYTDPTGLWKWSDPVKPLKAAYDWGSQKLKDAKSAIAATPGAAYDYATGGLDLGIETAKKCWSNEICQGAAIGVGVVGCTVATGGEGALGCAAAGAFVASLDNARPCVADHSASDCGSIAIEAGFAYLTAGTGSGALSIAERQVQKQLGRRLLAGAARFEAEGLTRNQLRAVSLRPGLAAAFKGERIDTFTKEAVGESYLLRRAVRVTDRFQRGPDFVSRVTGRWYDVTTVAQWPRHVEKYADEFGAKARGLHY